MGVQAISNFIAVAVGLGVGGHLLWKAWRDRAAPEALLGACLALDGIEWLLWALYLYTPLGEGPHGLGLVIGCRIGIACSLGCLALFTRLVFRPESRGAAAATCGGIGAVATAIAASGATGDWAGFRTNTPWVWIELACEGAAYTWTLAESLPYYLKMRRRVQVGLADGVVANSFALWAMYAGFMLASQVVYGVSLQLDDATGRYPLTIDLLMVTFVSIAEIAVWLAFFPPRGYLRWVRKASRPV